MFCLPYEGGKSDYSKTAIVIVLIVLGIVAISRLNNMLLEIASQDAMLGLKIIQGLGAITAISLGLTLLLIKRNHTLKKQIKCQQHFAQEICRQRDYDALSGLKNRNSFAHVAQQVENRGDLVSVMICDIDGLKIINDTMGHMAGDKLIQKAAEILKEACPANAQLFRMGGDEYLVLIPEVLPDQTLSQLRCSIKNLIASYNAQDASIPLSLSIGFAASYAGINSLGEVAKLADYNMYQEKRACQEKIYTTLRTTLLE